MPQGLVLRAVSDFVTVLRDDGAEVTCKLAGRLKKTRQKRELLVAGDRVRFELGDDGLGRIEDIEPRRSSLTRVEPGPRGAHFEDLLVANVDLLVIVGAASRPRVQAGLIDRFLVLAELGHVEPHIVLTKWDEAEDVDELEALSRLYGDLGIPVTRTSVRTGEGLEALRRQLTHKLSAFMGKSGAGKSSLLNALDPSLGLAVGALSEAVQKGMHTTRAASLHAFEGGFLVDTPGLRELGVPPLDAPTLTKCFRELRALGPCNFTTCSHQGEKGCAIRPALEAGQVAPSRMRSFRSLLAGERTDR